MVSGEIVSPEQRKQILRMNHEILYGRQFTLGQIAIACGLSRQTVSKEIRMYAANCWEIQSKSETA